jgi:hypothetical protein
VSEQVPSDPLLSVEGYICEAGCIDMGLKLGNPRAMGVVIELESNDLEIRGIGTDAARSFAKKMRQKVRVTVEMINE